MSSSAAAASAPVRYRRSPGDGLPPAVRWGLRAGVVLAHVGAVWALLQVAPVRESVRQVAPIMVNWIAPAQPEPAPQPAPAPKPQVRPVPQPRPRPQVVAAPPAPTAQQPAFVAPVPEPEPVEAAPSQSTAPTAPPAPVAPPAPPAPRSIPPSAVRYLVEPPVRYPARSQDLGEAGSVTLRVLVDERGQPRQIDVQKSSGYPRLDQAALEAMRRARFHPYTENGVPLPVWAPATIRFEPEE